MVNGTQQTGMDVEAGVRSSEAAAIKLAFMCGGAGSGLASDRDRAEIKTKEPQQGGEFVCCSVM